MLSKDLLLYGITDKTWLRDETLAQQIEKSLLGGITLLQLREKDLSYVEFLREGFEIKKLTDKYKIPLIINDNIDVAMEINAHGVHVGQDDIALEECRQKLGEEKIIGVSVRNVEEALLAEKNGATYLGVGAIFGTTTKTDAKNVNVDTLKEITNAVNIPVVAIGGINKGNIPVLKNTGIAGVAVISSIYAQIDIKKSTEELLSIAKSNLG
ncbi:MAG: thiamine phosphate synthase [Lachnospirales bacterium]